MTDEQIYHMATRFLGWKLPKEFHPDAGISFKPTFNDHMPTPMRHEPTGTNLLDYSQTIEMVRHMIEGLPVAQPAPPSDVVVEAVAKAIYHEPDAPKYNAIKEMNPYEIKQLYLGMARAAIEAMQHIRDAKSDYWEKQFNKQVAMDAPSYESFKRGAIWALDAACDYLCDNDLGSHQDRIRAIGKDLPK